MHDVRNFWLVESRIPEIFSCGIRHPRIFCSWNSEFNSRNPKPHYINAWNPESKFHWQILESSIWNPESTAWNPECYLRLFWVTFHRAISLLDDMWTVQNNYINCSKAYIMPYANSNNWRFVEQLIGVKNLDVVLLFTFLCFESG